MVRLAHDGVFMSRTPFPPGALLTHMKGMPYQFLFSARHSETMEEFAVYECLYENPRGSLWIRPRAMFEENAKRPDGSMGPRFAQNTDAQGAPLTGLGISAAQARGLAEFFENQASEALNASSEQALELAFSALVHWRAVGDASGVSRAKALVGLAKARG